MLKFVLLGLLVEQPRHGYELRAAFESLLGGEWPVNEGQIYTTLGRLERDGLVDHDVVDQDGLPARKVHRITELGDKALRGWLEGTDDDSTSRRVRLKDDLYLRVVVQARIDPAGLPQLVAEQRRALLSELADLVAARATLPPTSPTALLLDAAAGQVEADVAWLDRCESTWRTGYFVDR